MRSMLSGMITHEIDQLLESENSSGELQEAALNSPNQRARTHPNITTEWKIETLIEYREKQLKATGILPRWTVACASVPITPSTVDDHAAELHKRWYESDFLPNSWEYNIGNME